MSDPFLRAYVKQLGVELPSPSSAAAAARSGGWSMPCPYTNGLKALSFIGKSASSAAPFIKTAVLICVSAHGLRIFYTQGFRGFFAAVMRSIRSLPVIDGIVQKLLSREVSQTVLQLTGQSKDSSRGPSLQQPVPFPAVGMPLAQLRKELEDNAAKETLCENGRLFALVYDGAVPQSHEVASIMQSQLVASGAGAEVDDAVKFAFSKNMHTNALNPTAFPSLLMYETEVVSMCADLLHGDGAVAGSMTSGGTESVLMAFKVYRDLARKQRPWITEPEVIAPVSIHPAIEKAAHYFGFTIKHVPLTSDFKVDVAAMARAINRNTIALSASAPQYVHCVIDPIAEIGALALQHNLPFHVDACFGGFMLPFTETLGHATDPWDFRVPGVTSISADLHKYGYAPKGCSVVLYRNAHYRSLQYFAFSTWPGGLFCSPSICGTRPGPNIAAAWATLKIIGRSGYEELARKLMVTAGEMMSGINSIEGLTVMGKPQMAAFAFTSKDPKINAVSIADMMEKKGWKMERQTTTPPSIHCSVLPHHIGKAAELVRDLADCVRVYKADPSAVPEGMAGVYGMVAAVPDKGIIDEFLVGFFNEIFTPRART